MVKLISVAKERKLPDYNLKVFGLAKQKDRCEKCLSFFMPKDIKTNVCFLPAQGNTQKYTLKYIKQYNEKMAFTGGTRLKKDAHFFPPVCKGILQSCRLGLPTLFQLTQELQIHNI